VLFFFPSSCLARQPGGLGRLNIPVKWEKGHCKITAKVSGDAKGQTQFPKVFPKGFPGRKGNTNIKIKNM